MNDWHDPFLDDEAARERERRRAEREARRRERRRAIADKVQTERPAEKAPPAERPPQRPVEPPAPPPEAEPPVAPPNAEHAGAPPETERPRSYIATERERLQARIANRMPRRRGRPPGAVLWQRRLAGLVILLALGGIVAYGAISVADRIGGGDDAPPAAPELGTVTVAEGLDRRQIADVAKDAGVRGDYVKATKRSKGFDPGEFGAGNADSLEGFLFPATYELPENARAEDLVSRQLEAFRENVRRVDFKQAKSKNLTEYDVLKIASMIEREVQVAKERRQVAAVIYNRLAANNPLGIDATIRYEDQNYDKQLTESRLNEPTPYNTRINPGLPPTPIGNPGLAAIKAAANPARNDNFYFVVKPGTCEHLFTASEDEFNQASARYQRALEREGGSPTDC